MTDTITSSQEVHLGVFAQVLQANAIVVRNERVLKELEPGGPVVEVDERVYAKPGEIVDVSQWHGLTAYVDRGQIMLLGPTESEAHRQTLLKAAEADSKNKPTTRAQQGSK